MGVKEFAKKYLRISLRPHQIRWINHLEQQGDRFLVLAPRGHGKSTTITFIYALYKICHDPSLKVLIVSHKEQKGNQFARRIQNILAYNKGIRRDFDIQPGKPWRLGFCFLHDVKENEDYPHPVIEVIGKQGGMTGGRYDMVVFDDLLTEDNSNTEKNRMKIEAWINAEIIPSIDPTPKEKVIVVGTRKHVADWYSRILDNPDYHKLVDKAIVDEKPLWAERYSLEKLDKLKREMDALYFAREYMNEPAPPEGLRFKREWLKFYDELPPPERLTYYMGVDPGVGMSERASYFAICVIAVDEKNDWCYVVELYRGRHSLAEQLDLVKQYFDKWQPKECCVEAVMAYQFFYEEAEKIIPRLTKVDYIHSPLRGTTSIKKVARIENLAGLMFKNGEIHIRRPEINFFVKVFLEFEYIPFPEGDLDMLDALNLTVSQIETVVGRGEIPFLTL